MHSTSKQAATQQAVGLWSRLLPWGLASMVVLTAALSLWQYHRGLHKQKLLTHMAHWAHQAPASQPTVLDKKINIFMPLNMKGQLDTTHLVWHASRLKNHQVGFEAWAAFLPNGTSTWVWTKLGWIAQPKNPHQPPPLPPGVPTQLDHAFKATGIVDQLPNTHIPGIGNANATTWPVISVAPHFAQLAARLRRHFAPMAWRLTEPAPGWDRSHTAVVLPPSRHFGYALQWLALSLSCAYLSLRFFKQQRSLHDGDSP